MKFVKENSDKGVYIPCSLMKLSGFAEAEKLSVLPFPKAVLTMPGTLTAIDMLTLLTSLRLAEQDLIDSLFDACESDEPGQRFGDEVYLLYALGHLSKDVSEAFSLLGEATAEEAEDCAGALLDELHERGLNMVGLFEHMLEGDNVYE